MEGVEGMSIKHDSELNIKLASYIPSLTALIENGKIKPNAVEIAGEGLEAIPKAIELQNKGQSAGKKIVVKIATE
jgi:NADPH-dependent curcumin reductase CurA